MASQIKVKLLPSAAGHNGGQSFASTYLINDRLAIDAGVLGFYGEAADQARIRDVLITHTHADHIASLPIFVENAYQATADCVNLWGSQAVLDCLENDVFNDRVWPDLQVLAPPGKPFFRLCRLDAEVAVKIGDLRITPVEVNHIVPTFGFVLEGPDSAVLIVSDTAPTERIWEIANALPALRAVYLEATFPDSMDELAQVSKHLTSSMFVREIGKLTRPARRVAVHLKARYRAEIHAELRKAALTNFEIGEPGKEYLW